jgi:glycosyltransferase involved in cell wall biosynthesis
LIIAGNDEEGYREKLEAIAREFKVIDRIQFLGLVSEEHKWALYENAEMYILPSYAENFANTVAEAMSMGCPVIVTPEVGLSTFVREFGAGVIVNGAPQALGEAIRDLAHDSTRRREMGERGRRAVREHLSWDSVARRMETLLAEISNADSAKSIAV